MQFSRLRTEKEFDQVKQDWHILLANSRANPLFSSWELANIFWRVYGKSAQLRIICVHHNHQLIAIFPLHLRRRSLLRVFNLRVLQWLGTGGDTSPDYLGGIVHKKYADQYQDLLGKAVHLLSNEWDLCELSDAAELVDPVAMRASCNGALLYAKSTQRSIILAELLPDWDGYLGKLSSNRRQQIRRARRKVFEQEGILLDRLCSVDDLDAWFDDLVQLHHKRWQQKGEGEHAFRTESYNAFHRQLMLAMLQGNALRLWGLKKDGKLIAVLYCLSDGHTTFYYQGGFDTDFDELKPGMVLMSCAMEEAIKEGCKQFNMMKGDYDFKRSLAKEYDQTYSTLLVRSTLVGMVYMARFVMLPAVKRGVKTLLKR